MLEATSTVGSASECGNLTWAGLDRLPTGTCLVDELRREPEAFHAAVLDVDEEPWPQEVVQRRRQRSLSETDFHPTAARILAVVLVQTNPCQRWPQRCVQVLTQGPSGILLPTPNPFFVR